MITDNGECGVNGKRVTTCDGVYKDPYSADTYSLSDCEAACTAHKPCVGYFYFKGPGICYLVPSSHSCPTGFSLYVNSITAATSNDLEAYAYSGAVCYGKNLGNINRSNFAIQYFN